MSIAIVTLTRFHEIFAAFAHSVDSHESADVRRLAVTSGGCEAPSPKLPWEALPGPEPFCFARNANLGIKATRRADVLLTNDDVEFTGPILKTMYRICQQNPSIGLLSPQILGDGINNLLARASSNLEGFRIEGLPNVEWVESKAYVPFVCVYLPRHALDTVGLVNEEFTGYGGDDEDWCARAQKAGLKLAITPLAKVRHGFGEHRYSSSFLRVMSPDERERSCQASMARARTIHFS